MAQRGESRKELEARMVALALPSDFEVELKVLYTAVTRCRARLFLVETEASAAGDYVLRYLCEASKLAIRCPH